MERIGTILEDLRARGALPEILALSQESTEAEAPAPPACSRCRDAGFLRRDVPITDPDFGKPVRCTCDAAAEAARRGAGLVLEQHGQTFAAFADREGVSVALAAAQEWAEDPAGWLVLLGVPGTGKSHLLAAIANRLVERGESPRYWSAIPLLDWLREGFGDDAEPPYAARLRRVVSAPLLLLDDLGAERGDKPWVAERWQEILDARYTTRLPTALTSNMTLDQVEERLGLRIASRLRDGRLCRVRGLSATDYRPLLTRDVA